MPVPLTERMKKWFEEIEVHLATCKKDGSDLQITIAPECRFIGNEKAVFYLHDDEAQFVKKHIPENPVVAFSPGGMGAIRACYHIKGKVGEARLLTGGSEFDELLKMAKRNGYSTTLVVNLDNLYVTKPGPEAGVRATDWTLEEMDKYEKDHGWEDLP